MEFWFLRGEYDSTNFFSWAKSLSGKATTIFIECGKPSKKIIALYEKYSEKGSYFPGRQSKSFFSKPKCFRIKYCIDFLEEMHRLSEKHAAAEYADHLFLYDGEKSLVEACDFTYNQVFLSKDLSEEEVKDFARLLNLEVV